jgi:molecular chaperone Hsp33
VSTDGPRRSPSDPADHGDGQLILGVAGDLELRWAAADVLAAAEEARHRHDLSPIAATALGRALAGAALLRALATRACRRLTLTVAGDGPLGRIVAEADSDGNLRGMVGEPRIDLPTRPDGKLRIGEAVGQGMLRVHRELADGTTWESQVALVNGEIGLDLAHFLEQSEQTESAVLVGVLSGPEGLRAAGGLIVEVIPGAGDRALRLVEENLARIGSVSRHLATGGPPALVRGVLSGLEIEERERSPLRFRCSCRRDELAARIAALSSAERESIADEEGRVVAQCAFCGAAYVFDQEEVGGAPRTH